jgi:Ca2+-transporting ATPase
LKKTVFSTLKTNSGELTLVLLGLLGVAVWDLSLPILAVQILAIDLLGQIMPLTFLTFDPPVKGLMFNPPRDPQKRMLDLKSGVEVVSLGVLIGGLAFLNFLFYLRHEDLSQILGSPGLAYMRATSLTYATIVFCQYVNTLERRYECVSLFNHNILTNRILLFSIAASAGLVLMAIYSPYASDFLRFGGLRSFDWVLVAVASTIFLGAWEILKFVRRARERQRQRC